MQPPDDPSPPRGPSPRRADAAGAHLTGVGLDHWGTHFPSTHWSVLLNDDQARGATQLLLARVCDRYWYPLYAYLRKRGHSSQDAQDLTQGFLCKMLEGDGLAHASPQQGRFRAYLLGALKHYESDVRKRDRAAKRGGGQLPFSIEEAQAEQRYQNEPADHLTPEKLFDREWALALLHDVIEALRAEYESQGKKRLFEALSEFLSVKPEKGTYPKIAVSLGMTESNVRVSVNRLRKRYKRLLSRRIEETVTSPEDVHTELQHLFQSFTD